MTNTYNEVDPTGPQPHGDIGGDRQLSESWGRRFRRDHLTPDGEHVVVTVAFYIEAGEPGDEQPIALMREVEYMLCRDPRDPGSTEIWSDTRYDQIEFDGQPTEDDARAACATFDPTAITWDGEPLTSGRTHPVRNATSYHALMIVSWHEANRTWRVASRPSARVNWVTQEGGEGELDTLLSIARDVATGG